MNKLTYTMCAITSLAAMTSCGSDSKECVIEKLSIEVKDGMLSAEVLESFGRIGEAAVSPDGKTFVFTLTYESIEENKGNSEIYRANIDGSDLKRLTTSCESESNLQWIDNGERIAFLAYDKDSDNVQLFTIKPDGSGRKRISNVENGMTCFKISPDGSKIVYGSNATSNINVKDATTMANDSTEANLFKGLPKTSGRLVDDLMYKHWDEWVTDLPHPWIADFDGNALSGETDIMAGEPFECPMKPFGGAESFSWSPDSKKLVYVSRKLKGMEYSFSTDSNIYLYDLESGKTENLTEENPGYDTDPAFSPDGNTLAWLSMKTPKFESDKKRLMTLDLKTREKRDLTADWDYWPEAIAWRPDSKSIVFNGYYEGTEPIFAIDVNTCKIDTLAAGQFDYVNVCPLADGSVIALRHSMQVPNDVVFVNNGDVKQITEVNKNLLDQLKLGEVKKEMVPTTDGKLMTTWVIFPPDFDPNKKYPAILYCQGGPQQAVSQFWSYRWNFMIMAAHGYIVIAPNRRGVPGFGEEWNAEISGDYGGQNMKDYLAAVDYMKEKPYVDADHIGAIGASYGGFSVYWLAGHHEGRFAALIAHAGIFNIESQYLETEEMWFADYDMGGSPWDKSNAIAQRTFANSPHHFTDNWTAPILITVGELDYRILASQGMQAFNAAKMHGLEAEMLVFPDENHWILKPQNAILWQRVFFNFLDKYLKAEPKNADK